MSRRSFEEVLRETAMAPPREPPPWRAARAPARVAHFRLEGRLGRDGGSLYRACDATLGRVVALRLLAPPRRGEVDRADRAFMGARVAAALTHPNLVTIHEIGTAGEWSYAATELVEGSSLRSRGRAGPLAQPEVHRVVREAARGLARAHHAGVTHGRLSAADVLCHPCGHVKIAGLGLAAWRREPRSGEDLAPEVLRGDEAGPPADVFALGIMLRDMVVGPPAAARAIIERCLAPEPGRRFPDAHAVLVALGEDSV